MKFYLVEEITNPLGDHERHDERKAEADVPGGLDHNHSQGYRHADDATEHGSCSDQRELSGYGPSLRRKKMGKNGHMDDSILTRNEDFCQSTRINSVYY